MSQISRKNFFGKVVFPFLVRNFMSRDRNWFFGHHFVIVNTIFDFFAKGLDHLSVKGTAPLTNFVTVYAFLSKNYNTLVTSIRSRGYSTFILVYVYGPKDRKWGLKERIGTKNRGLKN